MTLPNFARDPAGSVGDTRSGVSAGGGSPRSSPRASIRPQPRPIQQVQTRDNSGHLSTGFFSRLGRSILAGAAAAPALTGAGSYFRDLQEWQARRSPNPPEVDARGDRMDIHISRDSTVARPFAFKLSPVVPHDRNPVGDRGLRPLPELERGRVLFDYEEGVESVGEEAFTGRSRVVGPSPSARRRSSDQPEAFISFARDRRRPGLIEPQGPEGVWREPKVTITVQPVSSTAVRLALRTGFRSVRDRRMRDTKYGRRLIGVFEQVISSTYGVVSEAQDVYENFTENLWYQLRDGRVVKAIKIADGNAYEATRLYLTGQARLDTAGFAMDYAISQATDIGYGLSSDLQRKAVVALGKEAGWATNRYVNKGLQMAGRELGVEDVRSTWVRSSEDWVRSFDGLRSQRVRALFP